MIKSMTGFGRGQAGRGRNRIDVEVRTVNSRYLDVKFKGLLIDVSLEQDIKKIIEKDVHRGNVYIRIELGNHPNYQKYTFNKNKFESIEKIIKSIYVSYGLRLNLSEILTANDLITSDEEGFSVSSSLITKAVYNALLQLNEMRIKEGNIIFNDLISRVEVLVKNLEAVEKISNNYKTEKLHLLKSKISDLLKDEKIDESRLIQEVAYYIERSDITEEIVRCKSHFHQIKDYLNMDEPIGKRLNFLLQEVGREMNTIGSKSPQTNITMHVIEMKSELEKIREQLQNIL